MKRFNILYIVVILVLFVILQINWNYSKSSVTFFGFAENKETEINHDHPVYVNKIHVTTGQFVNKGDLLMEVTHNNLDFKLNDVTYDIESLGVRAKERRTELNSKIRQLEIKKTSKISELETEIQSLQAAIDLNQSLVKDLKSVKITESDKNNSPNVRKIAALEQEIEATKKTIDTEIEGLRAELKLVSAPLEIQIKKLENEKQFFETEKKELKIYALTDGLIGNIRCKEGENKSSFATLLSFYERNPTLVEGYVHESLILHVSVGDSLEVSSSAHPEHRIIGKVTGLGSRIVEIPERLRKMPELKTYGREVLIQIPAENPLLQKEKVVLHLLNTDEIPESQFLPFLN